MRRVLSTACMGAFAFAAASAEDLSGYIGNTIVCTDAAGAMTKVWIMEGGKFKINRGTGDIQGTYAASGDRTCYTEVDPAPPAGTKAFCPPPGPRKIGDKWTLVNPQGKTDQCTLKEGTT